MHIDRTKLSIASLAVLAVTAVGLTAGYLLAGSGGGAAASPEPVTAVPSDATPKPGQTPDTSKALWYVPWLNQDNALARYDQTINGIEVGPTVERGKPICAAGPGSVLITLGYSPAGTEADSAGDRTDKCKDEKVFADDKHFRIPPDEGDMAKVRAGELSFFGARHGGFFEIYRERVDKAAYENGFASTRLAPATVAGHPAVVGPPIFEAGFGSSLLVVYDQSTSILTVIHGDDLSVQDLIKIAEGVVK